MHPRKLYLETTTRCNLQCGMCVKHAPNSSIVNKDFDPAYFDRIESVLPMLEALVLNGIGEPLLHPEIVTMVARARKLMPQASWIGFQSNGCLLDQDIAEQLFAAGLDRLCISVDDADTGSAAVGALLHLPIRQQSPLALAREVRDRLGASHVRLGAEIVLVRETVERLPALVGRLVGEGADFILATHLLAYHPEAEAQGIFSPTTGESWEIYRKWRDLAHREGIAIDSLTARTWIAPVNDRDLRLQQLYREMLAQARQEGIWLNVKRMAEWDEREMARLAECLAKAEAVAARAGVEISLPPLAATTSRSCRFIEDGAAFVDSEGLVMPCHPLWHSHTLHMQGEAKHLHRRIFGSIADRELLDIWQSPEYREFRDAARQYNFPFCHSCALGPCPDIIGETEPFVNDCFGNAVPCGHCLWCLDAVRCL